MTRIALQGHHGSISEEAIVLLLKKGAIPIDISEVEYVYGGSAIEVLRALHAEEASYGFILTSSSGAGIDDDTKQAMNEFGNEIEFEKIDSIVIEPDLSLMTRENIESRQISKAVSGKVILDNVFDEVKEKYPWVKRLDVEDDGIAAEKLRKGFFGDDALVIAGPKQMELYDLNPLESVFKLRKEFTVTFELLKKKEE